MPYPNRGPAPARRATDPVRAVTLITGASVGIGAELARVFAAHGHDLALVARSAGRLDALAAELAAAGRPRPIVIPCDLAERDAADTIAAALAAADARVVCLVNNAGYGLLGAVADLDPRGQLGIVDVNVRAVLDLTARFLPDLKLARGRILNVASMASYMSGPGMAVYYASKHFVSAFSRALSQELKASGVSVSLLNPGMTQTEFQARAGMAKAPGLAGIKGASARSVAEAGYRGMMAGRWVIVPGLGNRLASLVLPLLPDALMLPMIHRFQSGRR